VAASEVSKSAWTMLFGYGPGAGSVMEIERELSYRGRYQKIESWDNHFAYALFQSGYVGLLATLVLYLKALVPMLIAARNPGNPNRELQACLFAAAFVQVWMMTNVLVFAKQLDYLFWTLVASGFVLSSRAEFSRSPSAAPMPEHESGNDVEPSLSDVDCPQCKLTALSK
jgi:O-antigen ligase